MRKKQIPESEYEIVAGFYTDTIGREESLGVALPSDIALAYVDCDLYSSTRTVMQFLGKRMKHGMVVAFDDYYCYSPTAISGERLALLEFLEYESRFHFEPYVQFGWHGMSYIVEDARLRG